MEEEEKTYWKRVRYAGDDRDGASSHCRPWRLQYVEGRGYIALANRAFQPGEWICTEFPTVWVHGHHPFTPAQVEEVLSRVRALCEEDQRAFYEMANVFSEEEFPPAVGIFMTNSFDMTESIHGEQCCAMYLALARLNHACTPNAQQSHVPHTSEEVLYASRFIAKDEEINDCYIDLRKSRAQRRHELSEYYRFHCTCAACEPSIITTTLTQNNNNNTDNSNDNNSSNNNNSASSENNPDNSNNNNNNNNNNNSNNTSDNSNDNSEKINALITADDALRQRAYSFHDQIISLVERGSLEDALEWATRTVKSFETAEALKWSVRYLPEMYLSIYQILTSRTITRADKKRKKMAIKFVKKAHALNVLLQGPNTPDVARTKKILMELGEE